MNKNPQYIQQLNLLQNFVLISDLKISSSDLSLMVSWYQCSSIFVPIVNFLSPPMAAPFFSTPFQPFVYQVLCLSFFQIQVCINLWSPFMFKLYIFTCKLYVYLCMCFDLSENVGKVGSLNFCFSLLPRRKEDEIEFNLFHDFFSVYDYWFVESWKTLVQLSKIMIEESLWACYDRLVQLYYFLKLPGGVAGVTQFIKLVL